MISNSTNQLKSYWIKYVVNHLPTASQSFATTYFDEEFEPRYTETQRFYHNFYHMNLLCKTYETDVKPIAKLFETDAEFEVKFNLCLWFHDAIYDP